MLLEFCPHCALRNALLEPPLKILKFEIPRLEPFCGKRRRAGRWRANGDALFGKAGLQGFFSRDEENAFVGFFGGADFEFVDEEVNGALLVLTADLEKRLVYFRIGAKVIGVDAPLAARCTVNVQAASEKV